MANLKTKIGYGNREDLTSALSSKKIDGGDIVFTKNTQEIIFIRSDGTPMVVKSRMQVCDSLADAETYAQSNTSAYGGELISALVNGKYKTYRLQPAETGYTIEELNQPIQFVDSFPESGQEQGIIYIVGTTGKIWTGSEWKVVFQDVQSEIADKAPLVNPAFTGTVTVNGEEVALKSYVEQLISNINSFEPGIVDADNPLPTEGYKAGQNWRVALAGTYAGIKCEVGDLIICVKAYDAESKSDSDFIVVQANIDGAVTSAVEESVDGDIPVFNGTSGKVLKSSEINISDIKEVIEWSKAHKRKTEPYVINNCVFACGVPIVVTADTTDETKNVITWYAENSKTKSLSVLAGNDIYGGSEESGALEEVLYPSASVTINSGKVNCIFGGGNGACAIGMSTVIVNGGTVNFIAGGGCTGMKKDNHVGRTHVILNNVDEGCKPTVYGSSGESYATTVETLVEVYDGTYDYVTIGGSNGFTNYGKIIVYGGTIDVLQGGNRGQMTDVEFVIQGGTINKMFAFGEGGNKNPDDDPKFQHSRLSVLGGSISTLSAGYNGSSTSGDGVSGEYVTGVIGNEEEAVKALNLKSHVNDATISIIEF